MIKKEKETMNYIFGNTMLMSAKSLDYLWAKQTATVDNIANNDTPGYKAKIVTFEDEFRKRLSTAKSDSPSKIRSAVMGSKYRVQTNQAESARLDGNNVNTDIENVELARSGLQYQYVINSLNGDVNRLRSVIKGL